MYEEAVVQALGTSLPSSSTGSHSREMSAGSSEERRGARGCVVRVKKTNKT